MIWLFHILDITAHRSHPVQGPLWSPDVSLVITCREVLETSSTPFHGQAYHPASSHPQNSLDLEPQIEPQNKLLTP